MTFLIGGTLKPCRVQYSVSDPGIATGSESGLNTKIWTYDEMLLRIDSPEIDRFRQACKENDVWGVFSLMEQNDDPSLPPFNTAIIINSDGEIALHYRKLQPWVPIEPWSPGNYGMPVCDGPKGSKLAVCICHDGMFPELAREAATLVQALPERQ